MKNSIQLLGLLSLLLVVISCESPEESTLQPSTNTTDPDMQIETAALDEKFGLEYAREPAYLKSQSQVFDFATGQQIPKAFSKMLRSEKGVLGFIHTRNLNPESAYTVWMVVFANPDNCSLGACDENDIFNEDGTLIVNPDGTFGTPGVDLSLLWVDGKVSSLKGAANFFFRVYAGEAPGEVLFGPGLIDVLGSEIHYVIRDHGPIIPELLEEQLSTFAGGCDINICADVQFAIHQP